jgi:hypothetical protein
MHVPLQFESPVVQQMPPSQLCVLEQTVPGRFVPTQPPQCASSLFGSTHVPPQLIWPLSQQMPESQVWFVPHAMLH